MESPPPDEQDPAFGLIQVELQDVMGDDDSVANAAWTSSLSKGARDARVDNSARVQDLVSRLARDGHATPFESVVCRWWIRMPIFLDRQWMTHRIASHNGLSGRYRTLPSDYFLVPDDVVTILDKIKTLNGHDVSVAYEDLMDEQQRFYRRVLEETRAAEKAGTITNAEYKRVREIIRGVLGTAVMTERTTVMNLRSMANLFSLRLKPDAQVEFQVVASLMLKRLKEEAVAPAALAALEALGWDL